VSPQYQEDVVKAVSFLAGDHASVMSDLEKSMLAFSDQLEFEKAASVRDRICGLIKRLTTAIDGSCC
jgi:excinuclease ABC subunit C